MDILKENPLDMIDYSPFREIVQSLTDCSASFMFLNIKMTYGRYHENIHTSVVRNQTLLHQWSVCNTLEDE